MELNVISRHMCSRLPTCWSQVLTGSMHSAHQFGTVSHDEAIVELRLTLSRVTTPVSSVAALFELRKSEKDEDAAVVSAPAALTVSAPSVRLAEAAGAAELRKRWAQVLEEPMHVHTLRQRLHRERHVDVDEELRKSSLRIVLSLLVRDTLLLFDHQYRTTTTRKKKWIKKQTPHPTCTHVVFFLSSYIYTLCPR